MGGIGTRSGAVALALALAAASSFGATQAVADGAIHQQVADNASANRPATRVAVPIPPPLPYPAGRCDTLAPGLPGLNGEVGTEETRLLGRSVEGRPIWAEYWGPRNASTVIVVIAQIHGNECSPTLLVEALRRTPPTAYGVWLIPTMNPDGYAAYERRNVNGADLNADGGYFRQPESRAVQGFIRSIRPALTVHVHSPNGFAGAYPAGAPMATRICRTLQATTPIRCSEGGAGYRPDVDRWFLWQGLHPLGGETLLVELHAVSDAEVPFARPRPPTRSVAEVRQHAHRLLDALARHLGGR